MNYRPISTCPGIGSPDDLIGRRVEWDEDRDGIETSRVHQGRVVELDHTNTAQVVVLDAAGARWTAHWLTLRVEETDDAELLYLVQSSHDLYGVFTTKAQARECATKEGKGGETARLCETVFVTAFAPDTRGRGTFIGAYRPGESAWRDYDATLDEIPF